MSWRRAIVLSVLGIAGVLGFWTSPTLAGDALKANSAERQVASAPSADKVQRSLQRLMSDTGATDDFSVRLDRSDATTGGLPDVVTADGFRVVVVTDGNHALGELQQTVEQLGGHVEGVARSRLQARLTSEIIERLADLRDVRFIRLPMAPVPRDPQLTVQEIGADDNARSEGLDLIGTAPWHEIGLSGQGVRVGVIDSGFKDHERLFGSDLPERHDVTSRSFRSDEDIECNNCPEVSQFHGLATAEVVHDVAPRAQLLLSNFGTDVQFEQSINWMIEQDVDVINTSLGFPSGCFQKGGGIFEPAIENAREAGITWATSAGNEGNVHWQGTYDDTDDDGRHNFTDADNTFTLEVELVETRTGGRNVASAVLSFLLSWDADCTDASDDYDVRIVPDDESAQPVRSDWAWQPGVPIKGVFEVFQFPGAEAGETKTFQVVIEKRDADAPDATLDMLIQACETCVGGDFQYLTPEGSVSILEPSISPNAMTVGARHHNPEACGNLCPEGSLLLYSSRGPTKDGRTKPDIAAPTHVSTVAFGPWNRTGDNQNLGYTGTSAASPHAAGAAALVQQTMPDADPAEIMEALKGRAEDLGEPGTDNLYGAGSLTLGPVPLDTSELNVTGITPDRGPIGAAIEAVITGTQLQNASRVVFDGDGVTATIRDDAEMSDAKLPITLEIADDAERGRRAFRVLGPDGEAVESGQIVFTVIGPPRFGASTAQLNYEITVGDTAAPIRTFGITNAGDGTLEWTARTTQPWLTVNPTSGSAPTELTVLLSPGDLDPGLHRAQIVFEAEVAANSPFRVDVVVDVQQPELSVDPKRLAFATTVGESPESQILRIRNRGEGRLRWSVAPQQPWIGVNATSGANAFDLIVSVDVADLGLGVHRGAIRIQSTQAENSPLTVPVVVEVQGPAHLVSLAFERVEFATPEAWRRIVDRGCVIYRNVTDSYSAVRVIPKEGEVEAYDVPGGNDVFVCGDVVHIDTRPDA